MATKQKHVICRACHAQCGLIVDFEDGVSVATHGDKNNTAYAGFSCSKGRNLAAIHNYPSRLNHSMERQSDGSFTPIVWQNAARDISKKINALIQQHGPESVALYIGTFGYNTFPAQAFALSFMEAIKSPMVFTSVTIDQPGKAISAAMHGVWLAGGYRHTEWDGLMVVGANPMVSMLGGLGMNPAKNLHDGKKRGMKLIVIDPRKTELANKADLHLQCKPGYDAAILASIANYIIENKSYDAEFVEAETQGFATLANNVKAFTPEKVGQLTGLPPADIIKAAKLYSSFSKGDISLGTGPNMSGYGNISEYLGKCIMTLMGHWRRSGEEKKNLGVFINGFPEIAAGTGSLPATGFGKKLRIRNLEESIAGLPTGALADEILKPGKGQIKALLVLGGNPMLAWPDQIKTHEAMKALDLLVCFDPVMSKTAALSDYVISPKIHYERYSTTAANEVLGNFGNGWGYEQPYAQICDPILDTPVGSDLCEEQEFFHEMASVIGVPLKIKSMAFVDPIEAAKNITEITPGQNMLDPLEVWDAILKGSPISYREARANPDTFKGTVFDRPAVTVQEKPKDWEGYLNLGHPEMITDLGIVSEKLDGSVKLEEFPFRVISRRLKDTLNSTWHQDTELRKRVPHHPAYINPVDMANIGLENGDVVKITSERASIECVAVTAPDVLQGCLAVPHAWGGNPDEEADPYGSGGNTGKLSYNDRNFDRLTGIPIMSAIPVNLDKANQN